MSRYQVPDYKIPGPTPFSKSQSYSLSNIDVYNLLNHQCRVMSYDDLVKFDKLDDALGFHKAFVLLYLTSHDYGHWTLCFMYPDLRTVEFFDSYGYFPDGEFEFIDNDIAREYGENFPYLCKLLLDSGYKVVYNNHRLQEKKPNINTCGRHVVSRLVYRDVPIDKYVNMIKNSGKTPDEFVTKITNTI